MAFVFQCCFVIMQLTLSQPSSVYTEEIKNQNATWGGGVGNQLAGQWKVLVWLALLVYSIYFFHLIPVSF